MSYQSPKVTMYDISGNPITNIGADNTTNSTAKMPVLVGRANTAAPSWTDGNMVPLSTDLTGALRITGTITSSGASVSATGSAPPASATYVGGSVTTAAPSYTNGTMNALSLTTTGLLRIDGSGVTQPISAASLPLPTGAATETTLTGVLTTTAFQARINTLGQKTMANSTPVVLSSDQSAIPVSQSGSWTVTSNIGTTNGLALDSTLSAMSLVDNAAFTDGTTRVQPVGYILDEVAGTALTENDVAAARVDSKRAQIQVIEDGTTRGTRNTIKAASTAAVATDTALVVAISPNNTIVTSNASVSTTGTAAPASATYIGGSVTTAAPSYTNNTMNALSLTTTGLLRVDGSGVTQPVSNTVLSVVGGGTEATAQRVTIANDSTGVLSVDDNGGSLTVDGTVTANIGTTNGLALDATLAKLTITQGTALGANTLAMVGGSVTTAAPTYTTGNINPLSLMTTGALRIDNSSWIGSTAPTVGSKTSANSIPVVIASDQGSVTVNASATVGLVDNAAFTDGTTRIQPVGYIFDEVAGTALTENDAAAARIDSKRAQIFVIEDATTRGTRTTVKAASTAPVATDTALVVSMSPNSADLGITGTIKPVYGTNNQTVTITLASLTNTSARASTVVDNSSSLYDDVYISVRITTAAAGTSATGYINVYGYGSVDGGTTYPEAITGTDAGVTLTSPPNLVLIAQFSANTNGATKTIGPISFCRSYGVDRLPNSWGVVVVNLSGATLNATGSNHFVKYQGVNGQLV